MVVPVTLTVFNRTRKQCLVVLLLVSVVLAACAAVPPSPTPQHTALQKAQLLSLSFLERYKTQLRDAEAMGKMAVAGQLSPGQLEVYRVKRKLLIQVEPLIKTFDALVAGGVVPGQSKEQEINDILNRLASTISKAEGVTHGDAA